MGRGLKVLKFGGSSLAHAGDIRRVVSIISGALPPEGGIVVVSALKGVTNELVALTEEADPALRAIALENFKERHLSVGFELLTSRAFENYRKIVETQCIDVWGLIGSEFGGDRAANDEVLASGERLSVPLIAACLEATGRACFAHDAAGFIRTNSVFGNAKVQWRTTHKLVTNWFDGSGGIRVVTGFVGSDKYGRTTTLGRGGSDYSAAVLASVLRADVLERWTDVDGIYSQDPDVDPLAERFETIRLSTARGWNRAGRMGMHRKTLDPLARVAVPVHVRSTFHPTREGTWILP